MEEPVIWAHVNFRSLCSVLSSLFQWVCPSAWNSVCPGAGLGPGAWRCFASLSRSVGALGYWVRRKAPWLASRVHTLESLWSEGPASDFMLWCCRFETLNTLSLNWYLASEIWWDNGACVWVQETHTKVNAHFSVHLTCSWCWRCPTSTEFWWNNKVWMFSKIHSECKTGKSHLQLSKWASWHSGYYAFHLNQICFQLKRGQWCSTKYR